MVALIAKKSEISDLLLIAGEFYDDLYVHRNRNCVFKAAQLNESIPDMIAKNQTDLSIRPYPFSEQRSDNFVELTKSVLLYTFVVSQFLNEPTATQSELSSFLIEERLLIYFVLIGYLAPLMGVCVFFRRRLRVSHPIQTLRTIAPKLLFLRHNRMRAVSPKLALIFVFFGLFYFLIRSTLTSLIKTNAIILDTSQFINSRQRLFGSTKTMVICGNPLGSVKRENENPTERSFTHKLFTQKIHEDRLIEACHSKKGYKRMEVESMRNGLTSLFFFMNRQVEKEYNVLAQNF